MDFRYIYGDTEYIVRLEPQPDGGYIAYIDDRSYAVTVEHNSEGHLSFTLDGQGQQAIIASSDKDTLYVAHAAHTYRLERAGPSATRRRSGGAGSGSLTAELPGQVMEVLVAEGQSVSEGQTLLLLEAMKMEIRVTAPQAGTLTRLLVSAGDTVERGQQLAEVTP